MKLRLSLHYIVFLIGLFTLCPIVSAQQDLADVIEEAEKSVLRIEVEGAGGGGLGSGYIVDPSGVFVTNVHVMAGANKANAFFSNGKGFKITGTYLIDENRDICVCQLDGSGFSPIPLSPSMPRKGATVIALGSPHGLSFSATTGIVSAIRPQEEARNQMGRPTIEGTWIQVDAALSPGNSGGPLISKSGQVVGMSTLASGGGRAQNLNFGISIDDIRKSIAKAKRKPLITFKEGVGRIEMDDEPEGGGAIPDSMVQRSAIPEYVLDDYVQTGRDQYSDLSKDLRKASSAAKALLKEMQKGQAYIPGGGGGYEIVVQKGRTTDKYFFRSESVKKRAVAKQQKLARRLGDTRNKVAKVPDNDSLFALLMNRGPVLDGQQKNSIGFMSDGIIAHAFNDHDVIVFYEEVPYLMWVESTAGLATGSAMSPTPVYVAGTETIAIPGKGSQSVTILNSVTEKEIRKAIFGEGDEGSESLAEYRTWTDNTGKYSFEAILVETGTSKVVLKNKSGKIVTVPFAKLSKSDVELIQNYKK